VKISELFSKEGFVAEAAREYVEIGNIYDSQGDYAAANKFLTKALEIKPGNRDALLSLSKVFEHLGRFDEAIEYIKKVMEAGEENELLLRVGRLLAEKGDFDEAVSHVTKVVEADAANLQAKRLLGDIYVKKGEMPMAWAQYNTVLDEMIFKENYTEAVSLLNMFKEVDPIESRRKLISLYKQIREEASAVLELAFLAEIYEGSGMQFEAIKCYQEALSVQPEAAGLKEKIASLEKELGIEAPEKTPEEVLTEADIFLRYGLYDEARNLLEGLKVRTPENLDLHLKLKALYMDTNDRELAVTECIVLAELYRRAGEDAKREAVLGEAYDINPEDPRLAGKAPAGAAQQPTALGEAPPSMEDYAEEVSEADFYVKQGLPEEAAEIYGRLLDIFPDNEELRTKLEGVEGAMQAGVSAEKPAEETLSLEEFITPEAHAEELKEPELDSEVLEIFEEFKKGLSKELEAEDSETHYNLGIAYKEMGLMDDAIREFQIAKHDPKLFVNAESTLGMCYMQKGLYSLAAEVFSNALMKVATRDDSYWSLNYDLAEAYEKAGKSSEAFQLYTGVYGWNSAFRDVASKINSLKSEAGEMPPPPPPEKQVETRPPQAGTQRPLEQKRKSRVSYI